MYVKVSNQTIEKFPYSIGELRKDNPNVSFPANPSNSLLESWGVFKVTQLEQPTLGDDSYAVVKQSPELVNTKWVLGWEVKTKTAEQIAEETEAIARKARKTRDGLLSGSDWVIVKCFESGQSVPSQWATYRQALRDIPQQTGFPKNITWPSQPE